MSMSIDVNTSDLDQPVAEKLEEMGGLIKEVIEESRTYLSGVKRKNRGNTISWEGTNTEEEAESQQVALIKYEQWYNGVRPLIADYLPDRLQEFKEEYQLCRNNIQLTLDSMKSYNSETTLLNDTLSSLRFQRNLMWSIPSRVESQRLKAKKKVSNDIVADGIQSAKSLLDDGNIRASGVIAGVSLERHLQTLCETSEQDLDYGYKDGISSLSQSLNEGNEIDGDDMRLLDYLSGIRNKCSHADEENPEKEEVERMLKEADNFISST